MKNLRNRNAPPPEIAIQSRLSTAWDKVLAVWESLTQIEYLADIIEAGDLDNLLQDTDIDTIAKLNAILTDADLGDFASQAEAEAGLSTTKTMSPLRVAQAIQALSENLQNDYNASGPPAITDDSSLGWAAGSVWIDTTANPDEAYRCSSPAIGAAVWLKTTLTSDELALVALSGSSDDLIEGVAKLLMTVAERSKLTGIETGATADQSASEIEAAYNAQVIVVTELIARTGTSTTTYRWTPLRVAQAIDSLAVQLSVLLTGNQSIAGIKTFQSDPLIPDEAYGVAWNGVLEPPTKNAVYDLVQTVLGTKLDDWATPDDNTDLNANTTNHGLLLKAVAPAAAFLNVVGITNAETAYALKALFDNTAPAAIAATATSGTAIVAARQDHVHQYPIESFIIACSDETTPITASTGKAKFRMPYAFTVTAVRASVTTAPTGSTILIDINDSGTTILSTKLMIDISEKTSTTAATAAVISDTALADDAEISIDFDQVGSTIAGTGVKVQIFGRRSS